MSGYKKSVITDNIKEVINIHTKTNNITETAKEFCKRYGIEYDDPWRRAFSRVINWYLGSEDEDEEPEVQNTAKILVFDLETAPGKSYIWKAWNQNPGANLQMILADVFLLSWSAKWLFSEEIMSNRLTGQEAINENDTRIVKNLWELINQADIIIAHNADKFDVKMMNTRFLLNGVEPPMPYQVIDTLKHARKRFKMLSNKLDWLATQLGLEGKRKHSGFELWKRCLEGDEDALREMELYNIQDVKLLEEVYLILRPWIQPHPNLGLYIGENVSCCASCGSNNIEWKGEYVTYANIYEAYRCNSCGSIGRSRKSKTNLKTNSELTISTPK